MPAFAGKLSPAEIDAVAGTACRARPVGSPRPHAQDRRRRVRARPAPLEETAAPNTVAAFRRLLPLESEDQRSLVGPGDPLRRLRPRARSRRTRPVPESQRDRPLPGRGVRDGEPLAYGYVDFASKAGQLAGDRFATILEGNEHLRPLGKKFLWEGAGNRLPRDVTVRRRTREPSTHRWRRRPAQRSRRGQLVGRVADSAVQRAHEEHCRRHARARDTPACVPGLPRRARPRAAPAPAIEAGARPRGHPESGVGGVAPAGRRRTSRSRASRCSSGARASIVSRTAPPGIVAAGLEACARPWRRRPRSAGHVRIRSTSAAAATRASSRASIGVVPACPAPSLDHALGARVADDRRNNSKWRALDAPGVVLVVELDPGSGDQPRATRLRADAAPPRGTRRRRASVAVARAARPPRAPRARRADRRSGPPAARSRGASPTSTPRAGRAPGREGVPRGCRPVDDLDLEARLAHPAADEPVCLVLAGE